MQRHVADAALMTFISPTYYPKPPWMQRHVADAALMTFISPTYYKKPPKAPTGAKPRRMQRHVAKESNT